jgi:hypothetical protein
MLKVNITYCILAYSRPLTVIFRIIFWTIISILFGFFTCPRWENEWFKWFLSLPINYAPHVKSINTVFLKYLINIVALSRSFFDGSIFSFYRIGLDYILNETSSRTFRCFVFAHRTWILSWKAISYRLCEVKSLHVGFSSSHIERGIILYLTWRTGLSRFYQTLCWNFTKLSIIAILFPKAVKSI